jgi:hypothetical protein
MLKYSILEKAYVKGGSIRQVFKSKSAQLTEISLLESFHNIKISSKTIYNTGDTIILQTDEGYCFPIGKSEFLNFIQTVRTENGVILDSCCFVSYLTTFSILKSDSLEYIEAFREYELLKESKKNKFLSKDIEYGDIVDISKGQTFLKDLIYFGEVYTLPFDFKETYQGYSRQYIVSFDSKVSKRFVFGKISETGKFTDIYFFSSFPLISEKKGNKKPFVSQVEAVKKIDTLLIEMFLGNVPDRYTHLLLKDDFRNGLNFEYIRGKFLGQGRTQLLKVYSHEVSREKALEDLDVFASIVVVKA